MMLPVALFAGMLNALQIVEGTIEKAEAAPSALAESFRNLRLCIVRFIARRDVDAARLRRADYRADLDFMPIRKSPQAETCYG
jgi:hypothetical protein